MPGAFSSKRNLLFDLDGTLVDSSPAHARAFVQALAPDHPGVAERFDYAPFAGRPTRDVFLALGLDAEPGLGDLVRQKQRIYREALGRGEVFVFPGAAHLLELLRVEGRALFLVTGASRISAGLILRAAKLEGYFSAMVTAEDTPRGKPWPEPYRFALAAHGLGAGESLAIEDGENGLRSAQDAGLDIVSVHGEKGFPGVPHARNLGELADLLLA